MLCKLVAHALRVCVFLIHLVDCNDQRHIGRTRMLDSFYRLRHDTVIGGNHQHHDIRGLSTTRTHRGKCCVTRCIKECNRAVFCFCLVGTNMLGNTASLTRSNTRGTNVIEQGGLAVINVAHDRDHRWTWFGIAFARTSNQSCQRRFHIIGAHRIGVVTHLLNHEDSGVLVQQLIDSSHDAHRHHRLDHFSSLDSHFIGQLGNRDGLRHINIANYRRCRTFETMLGL